MMTDTYYELLIGVLTQIRATQRDKIAEASALAAQTIRDGGIIYIFGCGHSHLIALDSFYRAGGLANVSAILDTDLMLHNGAAKSSHMERMTGLAPEVLRRYCITPRDLLIVVSTSGKNAVPVEAALYAADHGIKTVGIVSSAYFGDTSATGKLLYQCVDVYIDNCVPHGDAAIPITGSEAKMGSASTAASSFIVQSLLLEAAEACAKEGIRPPIYMSGNVEGGKEYNTAIIDAYLPRIKHL